MPARRWKIDGYSSYSIERPWKFLFKWQRRFHDLKAEGGAVNFYVDIDKNTMAKYT